MRSFKRSASSKSLLALHAKRILSCWQVKKDWKQRIRYKIFNVIAKALLNIPRGVDGEHSYEVWCGSIDVVQVIDRECRDKSMKP